MTAKNTLKKQTQGYGYKYTDLAGVHTYLETIKQSYYQEIDDTDHVVTHILDSDGKEIRAVRGAKVIETGALSGGKTNPAQDYGSALTYARRYSLLLAFGLATEDDDAEGLTGKTRANTTRPATTTTTGGRTIDFNEVRERIKIASSIEVLEAIHDKIPTALQQYFEKDFIKREEELKA